MKNHPDADVLADLMSGEIETETLQKVLLPHLLECCPQCRRAEKQIQKYLRELDHWNASIALREGREAPGLLDRLMEIEDHPRRLLHLLQEESLHTWGLAQLLLKRCRQAVFENPVLAVELGELTVFLVDQLPPTAYQEDWHADLRIRTWAYLGNAKRVLGEHKSAEADLQRASVLLLEQGTGRPFVTAELQHLTASLRVDQRRFEEAFDLLGRAMGTYQRMEDVHAVGRCLVTQAKALVDSGREDEATALLRKVPELLDHERDPKLLLYVYQNLLYCLVNSERFEEAQDGLKTVRKAVDKYGSDMDRLRLRWIEGRIAFGLEDLETAETVFRNIQTECLNRRLDIEAAIVSLDLAVLYAEQDREQDLQDLLTAILPLFGSQDLQQEVLATLRLFQGAVRQKVLSPELARQLLVEIREGCAARA